LSKKFCKRLVLFDKGRLSAAGGKEGKSYPSVNKIAKILPTFKCSQHRNLKKDGIDVRPKPGRQGTSVRTVDI